LADVLEAGLSNTLDAIFAIRCAVPFFILKLPNFLKVLAIQHSVVLHYRL
jgi:hypothetical protein